MKIGVPRETQKGETRVALIPQFIPLLKKEHHEVLVERRAGAFASFSDEEYREAGATLVENASALYKRADIVAKVQPPRPQEARRFRPGSTYVGFLAPLANREVIQVFLKRHITGFSLEYVPRITRAQGMDALSSMATVAGYKAVLLAAERLGKMFPLMMTAAGTVPPATVLVLGAGVAGLQAIATAKRLGARVEAFDPRPAVKEQVKSLGAMFVDMEVPEDVETSGGYAKELSPEFLKKEQEAIAARLPKVDVVISTAQVFGKRAPLLITAAMVRMLRPGAVIVDLAAEQGGNCEWTKAGKTLERHGVTVIGAVNLPAAVPVHASQMYARNLINLLVHLYPKEKTSPDFDDEVTAESCITRGGEIVNESVGAFLQPKRKKS